MIPAEGKVYANGRRNRRLDRSLRRGAGRDRGRAGHLPDGETREMNGIVLTVGNDLMGDDGAGPRLAQRIEEGLRRLLRNR